MIANVLSSRGTITYKHRRNTHPPREDVFIFFTRRPDSVAERPLLIVLVKLPASISHVRVRPIMRAFYASPLRSALSIKVRRCGANLWNSLWRVQLLSRAFASVPRVFTIRRCSTIRYFARFTPWNGRARPPIPFATLETNMLTNPFSRCRAEEFLRAASLIQLSFRFAALLSARPSSASSGTYGCLAVGLPRNLASFEFHGIFKRAQ